MNYHRLLISKRLNNVVYIDNRTDNIKPKRKW